MRKLLVPVALLALACSLPSPAQDKGYWTAASSTASSITGDISLTGSKITIDFYPFLIQQARTLAPAEVSAAFDADLNARPTGTLYRLNVPAATRFLHRNSLCGTEATQWMATYASGRTLHIAFFSGSAPPVFTVDALADSADLCGTFTYSR